MAEFFVPDHTPVSSPTRIGRDSSSGTVGGTRSRTDSYGTMDFEDSAQIPMAARTNPHAHGIDDDDDDDDDEDQDSHHIVGDHVMSDAGLAGEGESLLDMIDDDADMDLGDDR